jgi:5-(aminomethyl)-3-furanmethanol phosphate kinase
VTNTCLAVIKVGGSLFDWPDLPVGLETFVGAQFPTTGNEHPLLIAGGGPAADVVREFDRIHHLNEKTAHHLALHAMDLSARLLVAVVPGVTVIDSLESAADAWANGLVPVLAPFKTICAIDQTEIDPLPASWAVTSDSIAARIALRVKAPRLVLLKSRSIRRDATRHEAARVGLIDPFFPVAARGLARVEYFNLRDPTAQLQILL